MFLPLLSFANWPGEDGKCLVKYASLMTVHDSFNASCFAAPPALRHYASCKLGQDTEGGGAGAGGAGSAGRQQGAEEERRKRSTAGGGRHRKRSRATERQQQRSGSDDSDGADGGDAPA